jgi:hypothetical protein
LHAAASNGQLETVKLLVSFNTTAEYIDSLDESFGRTALMMAAMKGYVDIVKYLIGCKAKVDVADTTGMNPHEVNIDLITHSMRYIEGIFSWHQFCTHSSENILAHQ